MEADFAETLSAMRPYPEFTRLNIALGISHILQSFGALLTDLSTSNLFLSAQL